MCVWVGEGVCGCAFGCVCVVCAGLRMCVHGCVRAINVWTDMYVSPARPLR